MFGPTRLPIAALLALAAPALGQSDPPPRDVVVVGQHGTARQSARRFATRVSRPVDDQLARRRWPICPVVLGLSPDAAQAIVGRIREVARAAGAPVARPDCHDGNAVVILSPDPAQLIRDIQRQRPGWLAGVAADRVAKLIAAPGPVRAWETMEVLNEDGRPLHGESSAVRMRQAPPVLQVMYGSILDRPTQQAINGGFLIIDARAAVGRSLTQVADYAAMRLLAATRDPTSEPTGSTILSLFNDPAGAPDGLAPADAAYLHALYHTPANTRASTRLYAIAGQMAQDASR